MTTETLALTPLERDLLHALKTIADYGDPWEIAEDPEGFGGTDDGKETVCMAYENLQNVARRAVADAEARHV